MTPLVLLVGFLGSGKTTFLKNLLPAVRERGLQPSVIINDYQNARVDAEQLSGLAAEISAISGDCVCCGSREELVAALEKFAHGPGRIVLVETNGTTDSEQLIEMLALEPALKAFSLPVQLSVIDSQRWQKRFWHNALEREQARTASHVFLSRTDTVPAARLSDVEQSLDKHQIRGRRVTLASFADEIAALDAEIRDLPLRNAEAAVCCGCGHDHEHDHGHSHASHDHGHHSHEHDHDGHNHSDHHFSSMEIALPELVSKRSFHHVLKNLPDEVIRAKGLVRFSDTPDEYFIFQKVDRFDDPQFFPVGKSPKVRSPLALFIGPELPEEKLREAVASLREGGI